MKDTGTGTKKAENPEKKGAGVGGIARNAKSTTERRNRKRISENNAVNADK